MPIRYFNALAGAGKTRALARYADQLARRGTKVLFVQPTKHLIEKTITDELQPLQPAYPVRAIHSDTALETNSVVGDIVNHFRTSDRNRGEVLFITHAAFFKVPYFERKADWVLLMDEAPQVDEFKEYPLPETHHLITPYLTLIPGGPVYGLLVAKEDLLADDQGDAA
jgi:hypothetical protein